MLIHPLAAVYWSPHSPFPSMEPQAKKVEKRFPDCKNNQSRSGMAKVLADDANEEAQTETKVRVVSLQPTDPGDTGTLTATHVKVYPSYPGCWLCTQSSQCGL